MSMSSVADGVADVAMTVALPKESPRTQLSAPIRIRCVSFVVNVTTPGTGELPVIAHDQPLSWSKVAVDPLTRWTVPMNRMLSPTLMV
jgi:hypothetical protein